ncbi:MAG: right-handed parallel beta-helix repeat-containing protein, partial [Pyrinomonadaceae bacterium]|nr:right-handed parallel beta-helix repeat-containing protein [Pyrinomonadaceae bacterium]
MNKKCYLAIATLFLMFPLATMTTQAATHIVTSKTNSGVGTLRQAVIDAADGDTIVFQFDVKGFIRLLTPILIDKNLTINGPGAHVLRIEGRDVPPESRVFIVSATVVISDLRISRGFSSGAGGGVVIQSGGDLTLDRCLIDGNVAESAGGVFAEPGAIVRINYSTIANNVSFVEGGGVSNRGGSLFMTNSLVIGNEAPLGGGVSVDNNGTATILNSTITGNSNTDGESEDVGGLRIEPGSIVNLKNSIVARNIVSGTSISDVGGAINSQGNNLIGDSNGGSGFVGDLLNVDPLFGGFANNGGATYT